MTRIDIISGFLGAGKTTLIKKLLGDALKGQQVVLIENEFGEIGIDGGFLKDAGIEIREMNSGCICCSLVGDFGAALKDVITKYHPDRIIIEPSGVGKLSDVIKAVDGVEKEAGVALNSATTVVDVMKCKMHLRNFGEFFENQVKSAGTIILSRTDKADTEKVEAAVKMLRELNPEAHIITTPVEVLGGKKVLDTMEGAIINLAQVEEEEHHHHHHDHDDDDECDDPECSCHHHHDDEDDDEHEHHHHHHHHHGHDADEVFVSWGMETHKKFTTEQIEGILKQLENAAEYGMVLRAKGYVASQDSERWIHFDYVPGESDIREGGAMVTGRVCVIGSKLNESAIASLFGA